MYGFSKDYQESKIFQYVLYGLIAAIVLGVITVLITTIILISHIGSLITDPSMPTQFTQDFYQQILVPSLLISSFINVVPAIFNMLAFNKLANNSTVQLFRTVGKLGIAAAVATFTLWLIGAALHFAGSLNITSIYSFVTVGSAISLVAWVLAAKAYYSIPDHSLSQANWSQPALQASKQTKYCLYCGAENAFSAEYCVRCGKKQ